MKCAKCHRFFKLGEIVVPSYLVMMGEFGVKAISKKRAYVHLHCPSPKAKFRNSPKGS